MRNRPLDPQRLEEARQKWACGFSKFPINCERAIRRYGEGPVFEKIEYVVDRHFKEAQRGVEWPQPEIGYQAYMDGVFDKDCPALVKEYGQPSYYLSLEDELFAEVDESSVTTAEPATVTETERKSLEYTDTPYNPEIKRRTNQVSLIRRINVIERPARGKAPIDAQLISERIVKEAKAGRGHKNNRIWVLSGQAAYDVAAYFIGLP